MANINLTDRALEYVQKRVLDPENQHLIAGIVWATTINGPAIHLFGLWRSKKVVKREGWWLFFYAPGERAKEWIADVYGLPVSLSPETQTRLDGKTLDFVGGHLQEIIDVSADSKRDAGYENK